VKKNTGASVDRRRRKRFGRSLKARRLPTLTKPSVDTIRGDDETYEEES
jgi:hypothetical protein